MALTQTITPLVTATETFGGIIKVDRLFTKNVLFTFVNTVNQEVTIKIYASNYNDPTMANSVLETTLPVMADGSGTRTTAGYQSDSIYDKYRVSATSDGAPTGTVVVTFKTEEKFP